MSFRTTRSTRTTRAVCTALSVGAALALMTGCAGSTDPAGSTADDPAATSSPPVPAPADGAPASWELSDPSAVTPTTQTLEVGVTRIDCSGGVTGDVLGATVTYEADRIVIVTDVAALPDGAYSCPGNDVVPFVIELDEPVGDRDLVDGVCADALHEGNAYCLEPIRWSPS